MVSCEEHHSLDADSLSVCTACPSHNDHLQSPRNDESYDEVDMGNANISSIKTASFWDDREVFHAFDSTPHDITHGQDMPTGVAISAVPISVVPVAPCLTTVMLRNIPNNITRSVLLELLKCCGFPTTCMDFVYLPMDFKRDANVGYAFVNLVSAQEADRFFQVFMGFQDWGLASEKVGKVCWGQPLQGLDNHIDRYRNSPVMHSSVPEEHKPMLFRDGMRIPFPEPTKRLRAPRTSARS